MAGVLDTVLFFFFFPANYFLPKEKQKKGFQFGRVPMPMPSDLNSIGNGLINPSQGRKKPFSRANKI